MHRMTFIDHVWCMWMLMTVYDEVYMAKNKLFHHQKSRCPHRDSNLGPSLWWQVRVFFAIYSSLYTAISIHMHYTWSINVILCIYKRLGVWEWYSGMFGRLWVGWSIRTPRWPQTVIDLYGVPMAPKYLQTLVYAWNSVYRSYMMCLDACGCVW